MSGGAGFAGAGATVSEAGFTVEPARRRRPRLGYAMAAVAAVLWGVNGAASVLASVLAITISLFKSISAAFWTGLACYIIAALIYWLLMYRHRRYRFSHETTLVEPGI